MLPKIRKFSKEENAVLTQIASGTPMGDMLRRYWWPVNVSDQLKDRPTLIRILGEDLVLFRDREGRVGLIGSHCSHRRANLCFGSLSGGGLRCRYHGWVYDVNGKVLETPGEPPDSTLKDRVNHLAYPAQDLGGLIWAYLGPEPAPELPQYDFLMSEGTRNARLTGFAKCHWLQCSENGLDPFHVSFTHSTTWSDLDPSPECFDFEEVEWGLRYDTWRPSEKKGRYLYRNHFWLMPGHSLGSGGATREAEGGVEALDRTPRQPKTVRFNTPIDETETVNFRVTWVPADAPQAFQKTSPEQMTIMTQGWQGTPHEPFMEQKTADNPVLGYEWPSAIAAQDATLLDSIGPVADRQNENPSIIDGGGILLREMLLRAMEDVRVGRDPKGVLHNGSGNEVIDIDVREQFYDEAEMVKIRARLVEQAGT